MGRGVVILLIVYVAMMKLKDVTYCHTQTSLFEEKKKEIKSAACKANISISKRNGNNN